MAYDTHFLECEEPASALVPPRAQPIHEFCLQLGVGVLLRWRGNDLRRIGGPTVRSRSRILWSCRKYHCGSFYPERQESHGHSGHLSGASITGSPIVGKSMSSKSHSYIMTDSRSVRLGVM
jgi:hypothetical protein